MVSAYLARDQMVRRGLGWAGAIAETEALAWGSVLNMDEK